MARKKSLSKHKIIRHNKLLCRLLCASAPAGGAFMRCLCVCVCDAMCGSFTNVALGSVGLVQVPLMQSAGG